MNSAPVSLQSVIVAAPNQISSELSGEAVILDLDRGMYHGLDATGARVWSLIQQGRRPISEIRDAMMQEFDVDSDRCERDLIALVRQLADQGLVEIHDA